MYMYTNVGYGSDDDDDLFIVSSITNFVALSFKTREKKKVLRAIP